MILAAKQHDASAMRACAVHEAAHAAVLRHLGVHAVPTIWCDEAGWNGRTVAIGVPSTPPNWRRLVGAAGLAAELYAAGESSAAGIHCAISAALRAPGAVSPEDAAMLVGFEDEDAREVRDLVRALWPLIESAANHIAANGGAGCVI